ncbi:hypothetical protein M427DRAFT_50706 [Gonapodya prolifera JEL478]|uniref:Large ribosomal subunit protein uL30-like ferredoxin-like fold domain-containing protein n=1 Tax=Gonapodya prolifera (strain JEL478) TaxID=1344416 RepID=A0A139B076_GONPJ|nr:hypothetical protein M427DRAFT_50706 [Gonapodya prolifera JEL478]|eukprot:KXS22374.1 hypothetical protein M427DRAFT_50706 [Gonapodya prolifera JEL478]
MAFYVHSARRMSAIVERGGTLGWISQQSWKASFSFVVSPPPYSRSLSTAAPSISPISSTSPHFIDPLSTSRSTSDPNLKYTHYAVTLKRSLIGVPHTTAAIAKRLGLTKRERTVYLPISASAAGQILKLKELVSVRNLTELPDLRAVKEARKPPRGYTVIGRLVGTKFIPR